MKRSVWKACAVVFAGVAALAIVIAWIGDGGRALFGDSSFTKSARLDRGTDFRLNVKPDSSYGLVGFGMLCDARAVDPASRGPPSA